MHLSDDYFLVPDVIQTNKLILTCYPYKILKRESCIAGQLKVVLEDLFVSKQDKPCLVVMSCP